MVPIWNVLRFGRNVKVVPTKNTKNFLQIFSLHVIQSVSFSMVIATVGIETTRIRTVTDHNLENYTFPNNTEFLTYGGAQEVFTRYVTSLSEEDILLEDLAPDLTETSCNLDKFALNCLPEGSLEIPIIGIPC